MNGSTAHDSGLLSAEPALLTEVCIGYARVSSDGQYVSAPR